ncbi:uncharacterized protein G6M90_00g025120 [Metarhizium brunneum]|uniref:Uncharacterized protein n=1 Tax=Metarhizium brunneum TaxID=500148 RepID=A0A7D5USV4_9HYPO|nr:hypothetical protein G6M90_00g025120 [Metarhizium brunneum]
MEELPKAHGRSLRAGYSPLHHAAAIEINRMVPPSLEAGGFMSVDSMYTQCTNFPPPLSSASDTSREIDRPANLDMEDSRNAPGWLPAPSWQSNWQRNGWDYGLADPFWSLCPFSPTTGSSRDNIGNSSSLSNREFQ